MDVSWCRDEDAGLDHCVEFGFECVVDRWMNATYARARRRDARFHRHVARYESGLVVERREQFGVLGERVEQLVVSPCRKGRFVFVGEDECTALLIGGRCGQSGLCRCVSSGGCRGYERGAWWLYV